MQGHLSGLRILAREDSRGAHCIHRFAHQLQLTLVAVAKNHDDVEWFFDLIAIVLNVIGASFKNRDFLRVKELERIEEALRMGELTTGRGLNQELGIACLNPVDSFADFDKSKLLKMARLYPDDFDDQSIKELKDQLDSFIMNVRDDARFSDLRGLCDLSKKLVETKKHRNFSLVFLLLKLALILPVATGTVDGAFSAMKYIKSDLRNRMGDEFLNDRLIPFVEYDVFESVTNDAIIDRFQKMKSRRDQV